MAEQTYRLPPSFYWDHVARDLPSGTVVRETKRHVYVKVDAETHAELLSDARHYAYSMGEGGFEGRGLIASAKATVRALEAAPVPLRITAAFRADHRPTFSKYRAGSATWGRGGVIYNHDWYCSCGAASTGNMDRVDSREDFRAHVAEAFDAAQA